jgi:hypothetical protein
MNWMATGCTKAPLSGQIKYAAGVTISISLSLNRRSKASLVLISAAASDGFIFASAAGDKGACQMSSGCANDWSNDWSDGRSMRMRINPSLFSKMLRSGRCAGGVVGAN